MSVDGNVCVVSSPTQAPRGRKLRERSFPRSPVAQLVTVDGFERRMLWLHEVTAGVNASMDSIQEMLGVLLE